MIDGLAVPFKGSRVVVAQDTDPAGRGYPADAYVFGILGKRVVAGDRLQLPPTTFFAAGDDETESDESSATGGFQRILDVMSALLDPPWSLDWHDRSRDEALIAYSNHRIYGGRLITFPGPGLRKAVSHELVSHVPGQAGQEQSASPEVRRVVDLIPRGLRRDSFRCTTSATSWATPTSVRPIRT